MRPEQVNDLINLQEKKLDLLKELAESLKYGKCKYHLVETDHQFKRYSLYSTETKEVLTHGSPSTIRSFIRIRKIELADIYNAAPLILPTKPTEEEK